MNGSSIDVLIADSQPLFGEAVRAALGSHDDLRVVGLAVDGMEAVSRAQSLDPDVAILDVNLPNCDGVRATRTIVERRPETRVRGPRRP